MCASLPVNPCAGMLAPDGRCKALDASADGYVRAEAAAAVVLRAVDSLTAAATGSAGGGSCHGGSGGGGAAAVLLLGTAVNQDGRSSSLTAPNGPSQQALIRAAVAAASLPAARLNLLSMHGTGTSLGDPIEVGAALAVIMHKRKGGRATPHKRLGSSSLPFLPCTWLHYCWHAACAMFVCCRPSMCAPACCSG
jgi:hypothetical protein